MSIDLQTVINEITNLRTTKIVGKIVSIRGSIVEAAGISFATNIGSKCKIIPKNNPPIFCEVIALDKDITLLMPYDDLSGVGVGDEIQVISLEQTFYPTEKWLGRVINAFGEPIDQKGPLPKGERPCKLYNPPPKAHQRQRVGQKINTGIKAINTFLSCCSGQRLGVFSGSGVGKSILLSMLTKFAEPKVKIIGLIGERGREVQEFLQDNLGEEGLANAIVIVATSDESSLKRKQAAYLTMALSEFFRDLQMDVLCILDSITRFASAQREIGLSAGEPPTAKGYTPSVFSELPKLLERAGPGTASQGNITGFFSVLVEGDDFNEPISDSVRSILDGHIILNRKIANNGIYPAIDILSSVSRTLPKCNSAKENKLVTKARQLLTHYENMADMIQIGAYKNGSDAKIDEAIKYITPLKNFINQRYDEQFNLEQSYAELAKSIDYADWQKK
jgi:flagellum-specific ATP synthase